jgi:hypothetical protein
MVGHTGIPFRFRQAARVADTPVVRALLVLVLVLVPASAQAATLVDESGRPLAWHQRVADSALLEPPDVVVTVAHAERRSHAAPPATIALSRGDWHSRRVLLHELGHVVDYHQSDTSRQRFMRLLGVSVWRQPPNSPHEKFAETWRLCATRARPYRWQAAGYGLHALARDPVWFRRACRIVS